jgi:GBP family porin
MKKHILSFAVLAACSAGIAHAADGVTIYGTIDAGLVSESGNVRTNKLSSGIAKESRIGFKGSEDLGNGLKALFVLEGALNTDTGTSSDNGSIFGRQSYVGLDSNYGSLTLGRQLSSTYNALHDIGDPFQMGTAGTAANLFTVDGRSISNVARVSSHNFGGLSGEISYGVGEVPGSNKANRTVGGSIGYTTGPATVRVAYENLHDGLDLAQIHTTLVVGSYDFGFVKANAAYNTTSGTGVDSRDYLIGGSVPFGPGAFKASFARKNDRSAVNYDADQYAIGYEYSLSKRTNLYTSFARISNDNGAGYTVGNASEIGSGDKAFNIGVTHSF